MKLKEITQEQFETHLTDLLTFIGVKHWPENNAIVKTVEILRSQFGHITDEQMMEAASLYAGGKITGFEHFNEFTPAFMGKLMTAMEKRLKEDGRLISSYDRERQYSQTNQLTQPRDCNWFEYLLDLKLKFDSGKLEESTLYIPLPVYDHLVNTGYLNSYDWQNFSTKASDSIAVRRKMKAPEFVTIGNANAFGTSESEAKKLCILQFLKDKCKIAYPDTFSWNEKQYYEENYNMVAKIKEA